MSPIDKNFTWHGISQDNLTDEQLEQARGHVERTLATMQKGQEELKALLPQYAPNMEIMNRFYEFLMAINDEIEIRKEVRNVG